MEEIKMQSSLSQEEIEKNFENVDVFSGIMAGLGEALAYEKGSAKAATIARKRSLPDVQVAEIRKSLNMSQKSFAAILGVSTRTVEAWEAGRVTPSPTAKKLMFLISEDHSIVSKLK
ncbi:MAG: helix-turn-helix domain-containing protein [Clostridia bacterium]|nr:helix-turn-helix domain-containing protein [Clostridia bacterium]